MVNTRFWIDDYISNLDPIEKLLFLYFLTNPSTDISGVYEIPIKTIAVDTGIDKEMVIKVVKRFEKDQKIKYKDGWVAIKNFIKHQKENPKVKRGIEISMTKCPQWCIDYVYENGKRVVDTNEDKIIRKKIPQQTRDDVFSRDGRVCQICGIDKDNIMYEIDHIIPVREGGGNEIENLRILCQQCNGRRNKVDYRLSIGSLSHSNSNSNLNTNTDSLPTKAKSKFSQIGAEVIKLFEEVDPKNRTYYNNKTERASADFLIDEYGFDKVQKVISILPKTNQTPYMPKITKPSELKDKWVKLRDAFQSKKAEQITKTNQVAF